MKYYFLDALAGAGKTYVLQTESDRFVNRGQFVSFWQPTTNLINQTMEKMESRFPDTPVQAIYRTGKLKSVKRIADHLVMPHQHHHVLFGTHTALDYLWDIALKSRWNLIVDEYPKVDQEIILSPGEAMALYEHLNFVPSAYSGYRLVMRKPQDKFFERTLREKNLAEDYDGKLYKLLCRLVSPHWEVFALQSDHAPTIFHALLKPTIFSDFKSVTLAGANFENSILNRHWTRQGVLFAEHTRLKADLRYHRHANPELLEIHHGFDRQWSKTFAEKDGGAMLAELGRATKELLQSKPFAYKANKGMGDHLFDPLQAERMDNYPHGSNQYLGYENIVDLAACNPSPAHAKFLQVALEWTRHQVWKATALDACYQVIMRGAMRDPANLNKKAVVVADIHLAKGLRDAFFDGCAVLPLQGNFQVESKRVGRPTKERGTMSRLDEHRLRNAEAVARAMDGIADDELRLQESCNKTPYYKGVYGSQFYGSLCENRSAKPRPLEFPNDTAFIKFMRMKQKEVKESKEDCQLISPAFFDSSLDPGSIKTRKCVSFLNGVFLDVEDGDMSPEDFAQVHSNLKIVVHNTASSTKEKPRFRLWMPTNRIMWPYEYQAVTRNLIRKVAEGGFPAGKRGESDGEKANGIDLSKFDPECFFFLPSRSKVKGAKIFKEFKGGGRGKLVVEDWVTEEDIVEQAQTGESKRYESGVVDHERVQNARQDWKDKRDIDGGHDRFFTLAKEISVAGLPQFEVEAILWEDAELRNPHKRRPQIPGIMKSLHGYGRLRG